MGGPMETPTDAVPARPMHPLAAFVRLWSMSVIVRNYARLRVDLGAKLLLSEPYAIDEKQIGELHCNSA